MMSGAPGWKYQLQSSQRAARLSSWFPGVDVAGTQGGCWGCHHLTLLRLAAKLFHVGADVNGLACHLHQPTDCG
jgi:hypothetical protein